MAGMVRASLSVTYYESLHANSFGIIGEARTPKREDCAYA